MWPPASMLVCVATGASELSRAAAWCGGNNAVGIFRKINIKNLAVIVGQWGR